MSGEHVINLVDVRLEHPRGGPPLVDRASLEVARGEVVLIVGSAGIGTSRLAAAALGELALADGKLEVLGRDVTRLRRSSLRMLRRRIGVVPQDLCLVEDRSAQLNVVLPLEIDGIPRSVSVVRAAQLLAKLGLESEASLPVDCLSASARQRVAVARALVRMPELVIADQPTSMQDARGAELVCTALAEAAACGAGCIVLGRDPTLRALAERHRWRQLALVNGVLQPLAELELEGQSIEDILVAIASSGSAGARSNPAGSAESIESAPLAQPVAPDPAIPNVVPFPISARTAVGGA